MNIEAAIPLFRIFNFDVAKAFYVDWLGFRIDWEHRLSPTAPRYVQITREALTIHLTEHYGDCSPGAKIFVHIADVSALHQELASRPNPNMRPSIEDAPWKARIMEVTDPFGNRLCFNQQMGHRAGDA